MKGTYLGDGAYVKEGSYMGEFILYTSNGVEVTDTVVLGPGEVLNLVEYLKSKGFKI